LPERITKVQRWLDLIAYLVGRKLPVSVEELMERLPAYARDWADCDEKARASVRRKFERDKDELRALGIPIETVSYRMGVHGDEMLGYRIERKDFYLPYLKLLEEEKGGAAVSAPPSSDTVEIPPAQAASAVRGLRTLANLPAFPLAKSARSALRKLTFDLDPSGFADGAMVGADPEETARGRVHLRLLSDALQRRKRVAFTYHGITRGKDTERTVRPWGLLFQHSHWYLVGWDEHREAERLFRVDRMEGVEGNATKPNTPDFEAPQGPVLERYRKREAWELGEPDDAFPARARFRFPTSLWAGRNGYGMKVAEVEDKRRWSSGTHPPIRTMWSMTPSSSRRIGSRTVWNASSFMRPRIAGGASPGSAQPVPSPSWGGSTGRASVEDPRPLGVHHEPLSSPRAIVDNAALEGGLFHLPPAATQGYAQAPTTHGHPPRPRRGAPAPRGNGEETTKLRHTV
jgi:predicted DNA-binding transcriptional regulator YafY